MITKAIDSIRRENIYPQIIDPLTKANRIPTAKELVSFVEQIYRKSI